MHDRVGELTCIEILGDGQVDVEQVRDQIRRYDHDERVGGGAQVPPTDFHHIVAHGEFGDQRSELLK